MTTNSNTDISSSPKGQSSELLDKIISDTFDELLIEISSIRKLHKSEEYNRDIVQSRHTSWKIYDEINSYHSFCELCEQHFYSLSSSNDINSFFQKHINTSYHRQMCTVALPPDDVPMFEWEEKYRTGRCNVCQMSGLNAYVLKTRFDSAKSLKLHVCVWDKEHRESNQKLVKKLNLLKKYCRLKIFRERLLKTVNGSTVCLLCRLKLPWSLEEAKCHLGSDIHYQNFCVFLKKCFNFAPRDILNGFNLEFVTRSVITRDPPPISEFSDFTEKKQCLEHSNDNENPYLEEKDNLSFSPKHVEEILNNEETDFIHCGRCLLCDVEVQPDHINSDVHKNKTGKLDLISEDKEKFSIYSNNKTKRLFMMEYLKKLDSVAPMSFNKVYEKEPKPKVSSQTNYIKMLVNEKLEMVNLIVTGMENQKAFCHLCDKPISVSSKSQHLNSNCHKRNTKRWDEVKEESENNKFLEPFLKIKHTILCLLCGAVINPNCFFSHLKGETHKRKFQWYSCLNVSTPISSAFVFQKDFSCVCATCNSLLSERLSPMSLKVTLKNIRHHWPCWKQKDGKTDVKDKLEVIFEANKTLVENNQNLVNEISGVCRTCGGAFRESELESHEESCGVNFKKVGDAVESSVNVFENNILESVLDKSTSVIKELENLELVDAKEETGNSDEIVQKATPFECEQPETCSPTASSPTNGDKEEVKEDFQKVIKNELKTENKTTHIQTSESKRKSKKENKQEKEHEVLIIAGLPKSRRTYETIYSRCSIFGEIRYVYFDGKVVIVAFTEPGVAEKVAKETSFTIDNHKLSLSVSTRKKRERVSEKLPKDLICLLKDPLFFMDFTLNLVRQATAMSESAIEKKREVLVCSTIISAIFEHFPQGRCYPFGSRLSGLTLKNSDLDVFLDCGGMYEGFKNTTPSTERTLVNKVAGLLRKKQEITNIIVVNRARVPIISFLHKPTRIHCDLSFKNGLSIQNTLLIKFMLSLDWRVRPLILFLKLWAQVNGLHGPPNFSSYAISMMVIYFLEQLESPVLPTIETLQKNSVGPRTTIGGFLSLESTNTFARHGSLGLILYFGWDCTINTDKSCLQKFENRDPLPKLLLELFEFYANFDYDRNIISPLTGTPLPRDAFSELGFSKMPLCYKRHILNMPTPLESLVHDIPICVVDPFDLSHVLTKNFSPQGLQNFTRLCKDSVKYLKLGMGPLNAPK